MPLPTDIFLKKDRAKTAKAWMPLRGVSFYIASALNEGYTKAVADPAHDDDETYSIKAIAEHLILDWKGLDKTPGVPMEPTMDNKIKLLTDFTEIGSLILRFAYAPVNFVAVNNVEEELGNSQAS